MSQVLAPLSHNRLTKVELKDTNRYAIINLKTDKILHTNLSLYNALASVTVILDNDTSLNLNTIIIRQI